MPSLQMAEITGKPHYNVTGDIKRILAEAEIDAQGFLGIYKDAAGRDQHCYHLPRRECDLVISGYSMRPELKPPDSWHLQRSPEISGFLQGRLRKVERWGGFLTFRK